MLSVSLPLPPIGGLFQRSSAWLCVWTGICFVGRHPDGSLPLRHGTGFPKSDSQVCPAEGARDSSHLTYPSPITRHTSPRGNLRVANSMQCIPSLITSFLSPPSSPPSFPTPGTKRSLASWARAASPSHGSWTGQAILVAVHLLSLLSPLPHCRVIPLAKYLLLTAACAVTPRNAHMASQWMYPRRALRSV